MNNITHAGQNEKQRQNFSIPFSFFLRILSINAQQASTAKMGLGHSHVSLSTNKTSFYYVLTYILKFYLKWGLNLRLDKVYNMQIISLNYL